MVVRPADLREVAAFALPVMERFWPEAETESRLPVRVDETGFFPFRLALLGVVRAAALAVVGRRAGVFCFRVGAIGNSFQSFVGEECN